MSVIIDGQKRDIRLNNDATLGDAFQLLSAEFEAQGRIVIAVTVAGQKLEGESFTKGLEQPVGNQDIAFETQPRTDMARNIIGQSAALVQYLATRHHEIANLLSQGQTQKALVELSEVLTSWQQVQGSFSTLTKLLKLDLTHQMVGDKPALDLVLEFRAQLEEIGRALKAQDMVLLGDVLQYELDTGIAHWNDLLATILGIVDGVVEKAA